VIAFSGLESLILSQTGLAAERADKQAAQWIADHAIRLETPEAGHGFADLQALKPIVGNARIIALGEATHGTREFFQLKHRILEFLATEMGFSIFSIEANMPEAYRLNDFILNGQGDPSSLIKGMYFWTWNTEEVLDMVLWMREFNKSGKGRIQFTGFDMQMPDVAIGIVNDFLAESDQAHTDSLRTAIDMAKDTSPYAQQRALGFARAIGTFPLKDAAGKTIRFSGYIRTKNVTGGWAGLWLRADGADGKTLAFDNMEDRGAIGTTDWKRYVIELPIAADTKNISYGALFGTDGIAWFDDLQVELDGKPWKNNDIFDFDFESPSPKGFHTAGDGCIVQLDSQVAHGGKQSLRMTKIPPAVNSKSVDPGLASSTWKELVRHMESSRELYRKKGISPSRIEWAIQNARVVWQCMKMQTKEVSRDASMAENVKWILEQNPGAKVVLWAHNGHVSTERYGSMGSCLRRIYKDQMAVFGFAFNQGSFQAIEPGKELRDFTIPPAPDGSFEATLAASGIPIFALDLRAVPKTGPVSEWFSQKQTRNVGSIFSDSTPGKYWLSLNAIRSFDAMLFVEKTTAARKNQR
jgi:erythromycin esterase-like protein